MVEKITSDDGDADACRFLLTALDATEYGEIRLG
jgi:hypothetical protein